MGFEVAARFARHVCHCKALAGKNYCVLGYDNRMLRGYALQSRRSAASSQEQALRDAGVTVVYLEGRGPEGFDALLASLRKGDAVAVVRLADIAIDRKQLRKRVEAVHEKGCHIVETDTKRDSRKHALQMVFDAHEMLTHAGKGHNSERASKYGAMGGRPPKKRAMAKADAEKVWFDLRHERNADALKNMSGWTASAAYREFGASGRPKGPRRPIRSKLRRRS